MDRGTVWALIKASHFRLWSRSFARTARGTAGTRAVVTVGLGFDLKHEMNETSNQRELRYETGDLGGMSFNQNGRDNWSSTLLKLNQIGPCQES